jgi:hypothetical protein
MKKKEVKNLSEAEKRIKEVLKKEKKVLPPTDVKPQKIKPKT